MLGNRDIVAYEDGQPVRKGTVVGKLFSELGPRYLERPGGYTRIIRLSLRRLGDNGELVLFQLLGEDEPVKREKRSTKRRARRKRKETDAAKEETEAVAVAEAEEEPVAEAAEETEEQDAAETPEAEEAGSEEQEQEDKEETKDKE
jgi:large subunit ribosomal protein L17